MLFGHIGPRLNENRLPADIAIGIQVIWLTRLNRIPLVLNSDMIEHIETTPDTVITLSNGQILRVRESVEEVIDRIVAFRRRICGPDAAPHDLCEASGPGETGTALPQAG
jgi:flagellar protein FlbD